MRKLLEDESLPRIALPRTGGVFDDELPTERRDWLLQGSFSIYKRDWNMKGFAPSLSLTTTRNLSTLDLYDEKRVRGEIRLTRAF